MCGIIKAVDSSTESKSASKNVNWAWVAGAYVNRSFDATPIYLGNKLDSIRVLRNKFLEIRNVYDVYARKETTTMGCKREIIILKRISCRVDVDQGRFASHLSPTASVEPWYKQRLGNQISWQVEKSRIAEWKTRGPGFLQKFIRDWWLNCSCLVSRRVSVR